MEDKNKTIENSRDGSNIISPFNPNYPFNLDAKKIKTLEDVKLIFENFNLKFSCSVGVEHLIEDGDIESYQKYRAEQKEKAFPQKGD
jgi:hypothetical protein